MGLYVFKKHVLRKLLKLLESSVIGVWSGMEVEWQSLAFIVDGHNVQAYPYNQLFGGTTLAEIHEAVDKEGLVGEVGFTAIPSSALARYGVRLSWDSASSPLPVLLAPLRLAVHQSEKLVPSSAERRGLCSVGRGASCSCS